jgi:FtsZ-binding cell division protein ZapB
MNHDNYFRAICEDNLACIDILRIQIRELREEKNRLATQNLKLRQHLDRCRKVADEINWTDRRKWMLNPHTMITRREYYVRQGHPEYAIWINDLNFFPCINFIFEVT